MRIRISVFLISLLFMVSAPGFVAADVAGDIAKNAAGAIFSEAERQVIEEYYKKTGSIRGDEDDSENDNDIDDDDDKAADKSKHKDKGKKKDKHKNKGKSAAKHKELPKGIAKKLERGGTLPPGIAKRGLPSELEQDLPPPPTGYERVVSDGKVVLADVVTGVINDIINVGGLHEEIKTVDKPLTKSSPRVKEQTPEKNQSAENPEKKWWQIWKD